MLEGALMKTLSALIIFLLTVPAAATLVEVTVTGEVEFNQIGAAPLGNVNSGDPVVATFMVDSDVFTDSVIFPTRGYPIIPESFALTMGAVTIGLQMPLGETPFFVLRDNDPAVDGFLIGSSPDVGFPNGAPIDQTGIFDQFRFVYATTYGRETLSSLDVLDAQGTYDFTGLTVFSMRIADGPVESAMGMVFADMTIAALGCAGDITGPGDEPDGNVDALDFLALIAQWGTPCAGPCDADITGPGALPDGNVDSLDYLLLIAQWGTPAHCPAP
jgi:hypothetical protein